MRIENLLLNNISTNLSENVFKEGSIFKAEVLEILEGFTLIDIKGQGKIKASSDIEMKSLIGEEVSFLVKSNKEGIVELKPLIKEEILDTPLNNKLNNSISKVLNNFNIQDTEASIELVESLMKYNVPITEENLLESIKISEKLLELTSLKADDKVVLFETENLSKTKEENLNFLDFKKDIKIKTNQLIEKNQDLDQDLDMVEKTNIKNLVVVDKNTYFKKKDMSNTIKGFLGDDSNLKSTELNKLLGFFIKNKIKPSLNNIKNFKDLSEDPIKYSKDLVNSIEVMKELEVKSDFNKLKEQVVNIKFNSVNLEKDSEDIKNIQEIIEKIELKSRVSSDIKKEINELENKIDFLKEMDQDLSFLFLPINYGEKELEGIFAFLKENKNKKNVEENLNVFINLDTNNLGNIKISCQAKSETLSIKINIQEKDLNLFQSAKQGLINRIESIGYIVNNIEFITDKKIDIMDTIIVNPDPNYFLDIKV